MTNKSKFKEKAGPLDVASPATATAFRKAAKSYTKRAIKTKTAALKTLRGERILKKSGGLAKPYA